MKPTEGFDKSYPVQTKTNCEAYAKCVHNSGDALSGLILCLRLANERRRYFVTTYLIGWMQAYNQACLWFAWFWNDTEKKDGAAMCGLQIYQTQSSKIWLYVVSSNTGSIIL